MTCSARLPICTLLIAAFIPDARPSVYFSEQVSLLVWVLTHLPLNHGHSPELEHSAIAYLGHGIEPLIRPLGFNWKIHDPICLHDRHGLRFRLLCKRGPFKAVAVTVFSAQYLQQQTAKLQKWRS
jgi:hypothetical protein